MKKKKYKIRLSKIAKEQMKLMTPKERKAVKEIIKQLKENPYRGKPLFKSKKLRNIRYIDVKI